MNKIITADVRAAMERLRDTLNGDVPWEYAGTDGIEYRENDERKVINAMLALFPGDMPEPVEMFKLNELDGAGTEGEARHLGNEFPDLGPVYRGFFIPLERIEVTQ